MPLKIVLRAGEKIAINQAVILNGGEKAELVLENKASILRERDIMSSKEADSPAKRIYFLVQMIYMFPEKESYYHQKFNQIVKQQLGINSLALASQSERGILALFG